MGYGKPQMTSLIVHSSLFLAFLTSLTHSANAEYRWRADSWSDCEKPYGTCGRGGTQRRNVWCEKSYPVQQSVPHSLCRNSGYDEPLQEQSCYKSCDSVGSYQVRWVVGRWSECQIELQGVDCAKNLGYQTRDVYCVYQITGDRTEDSVCASFNQGKPPTRQSCKYNCPQNCVVGKFSEWSSCDDCRFLNRSRTRDIIVPNNNRGKPCPAFSEMSPCSNCSDKYFLNFTPWSFCQVFPDPSNSRIPYNPYIGNQDRSFDCFNIRGQKEELSKCTGKFQPFSFRQSCIISQDCVLGPWQGLTTINQTCVSRNNVVKSGYLYQKRDVIQIPLGDGKPCGPLEEYIPIKSSQKINCPRTQWIMSDWSECKPIQGHQQCNTGIQDRYIFCVQIDQAGRQTPVEESECSPEKRPLSSRTCPTQCKTDCTVSIWSQWSQCKVTDCEMYARRRRNNKKTGQRYRTRATITEPAQGGQMCPHLSETQNCDPEPCYTWHVKQGVCIPQQSTCGVGISHQTVSCFNRNMTSVVDSRCSELKQQPPTQVQCVVSCADDCVLSEWTEWSECPRICQNNIFPRPTLKHRTRTILAKAAGQVSNCQATLREQGECPTVIECDTYTWQPEPWGPCLLDNPVKGCGRGERNRIVHCYSNLTSVSEVKCALEVKPPVKEVCTEPCPENCNVSTWSAWSECSATCTSANTLSNPSKSRRRYIEVHPKNGGVLCPSLLKEVKVCFDLPVCNQYQWNVTDWSECILHRKEKCGRGLKARNVTCLLNDGSVSPINNCLTSVGQMPVVAEPCYIACEDECLFTDWTPWSKCLQGCGSKRFRQRSSKIGSNPPPECSDMIKYPRYEPDICHCDLIKEELGGEFSQCILDPPKESSGLLRPISTSSKRDNPAPSKGEGKVCGWGQKIRYVACQSRSAAASIRRCSEAVSLEVKHCNIPCPNDCKMALWSEWSKCPSKCRPGIQKRSRYIEQLNSAGGRQCPSLDSTQTETQTRLCHPECSQYIWKAYEWSMCDSSSRTCGDGTQRRVVNCVIVNVNGDTTGITTEDNCAGQVKPHSEQQCRLACVGECVMSDWTEWTECPRPCSNGYQKQTRTRKIMRHASRYHPRCVETEDYRDCIKDINCVDYHWSWMPWTSCLINNGNEECGRGLQERFPMCRTHNEVDVDDRICTQIIGPPEHGKRTNDCEVPCDVDCLVSDWTEWSSCSQTCGIGESTRERVVVEQYTGNGRKCPSDLVQTKPCYPKGCYRWTISDWSPCMPQKNMCGAGIQTRNVSCLGDDGLPADPEKCPPDLDILVLKTEQKCEVLCPWDCVLTEWSEWSKCFVNCADFAIGATQGKTSRSRAIISQGLIPCNDKLWETKICPATDCTSFSWVASPWTNGKREVSCQTSDGLRVNKEACHGSVHPSSVLSCDPPCNGDHMVCNDTNTCGCEADFVALTDIMGQVVRCVEQNSTLSVGAQKKDSEEEIETNYWMYAVVAAGTLFIVFVALALYHMSDFFKNGPRPHGEPKEEKKSIGIESTDTATRISRQGNENCNVCSQIPVPVETMVTTSNGRAEIRLADDVGPYVQSWNRKGLANRLADALSCLIPCMTKNSYSVHVHENINETRVKMPLENMRLIGHEGNSLRDESMETEFNEISNLVHTPSYYMAVSMSDAESHRSSKVITLPQDKTDNYLCDSLDTETSSPDSTKSQVKRSQSDSAISIPTSNSQGACSGTNSPSVKKDKILKKRAAKFSEHGKYAKHSSTQTSTQSSAEEMGSTGRRPAPLTYQDSRETQAFPSSNGFPVEGSMDDYLEKMNSLNTSNENLNKRGEEFLQHEEITAAEDHLPESDVNSPFLEASGNHVGEISEVFLGNLQEQAEFEQLLPSAEDGDSVDSKEGFCVFVPSTSDIGEEAILTQPERLKQSDNNTSHRRDRLSRQRKIDGKDPTESDHNSNVIPDLSGDWSHDPSSPVCNSVSPVGSPFASDNVTQSNRGSSKKSKRPLQTSSPREVKSQNSSHKKTTPV